MDAGRVNITGRPGARRCAFLLIMLAAVAVRVIGFGSIPCGLNQDEAFAGYEAFSLLNYGVDSAGYRSPCYFVSWGSGMNVLESYLAIPFMKLFGPSAVTVRLPQLLLSLISLPVFYLLLRTVFSERTALTGLALLAVSPWHIMLSRWGLESNLAPSLLLIGLYFLIRGVSQNKYLILSAAAYGISLYSYAITWLVVPLTLLLCGGYILFSGRRPALRYLLISGALLFILALPLILFLLVNTGLIPEISAGFFSVPKLPAMRSGEISLKNLLSADSYVNLFSVFVKQDDGLIWNSAGGFGLFYPISLPFILLGGAKLFAGAAGAVKKRARELRNGDRRSSASGAFDPRVLIVLGMISSVFVCLLIRGLNINKANSLHFYTLIFLTAGVREACVMFKNRAFVRSFLRSAVICAYAVCFGLFCLFYFGSYNGLVSGSFGHGLQEAVEYVKERDFDRVCVGSGIYYSQILFYDQTPAEVFSSTVEYTNYPSEFLDVSGFGDYEFGIDYGDLRSGRAYIAGIGEKYEFTGRGYEVIEFGDYIVAYETG